MFVASDSGILLPAGPFTPKVSGVAVTWDPANSSTFGTLSNGNLTYTSNSGSACITRSTVTLSGLVYWEDVVAGPSLFAGSSWAAGIVPAGYGLNQTMYAVAGGTCYRCDNRVTQGVSTLTNAAPALAAGDVVGIEVDVPNGTVKYYKNNSLVYTVTGMTGGPYYAATHVGAFAGNNSTLRAKASSFSYPTRVGGYQPLGV